uniref:Uncharacterized protein n=1 Tax=Panagrolaimus sp. ES5 TaxID=591445 RepID=A0AC34GP46_9BILA
MQTSAAALSLLVAIYVCSEVGAFEFDFVGKSNNFASGDDYIRGVGTRRDLSLAGGSSGGMERPSAPRRLIQPPPLKRSIKESSIPFNDYESEKLLDFYRWLQYNNNAQRNDIY